MDTFTALYKQLRAGLYCRLPILAMPLGLLECRSGETVNIGTDGERLWISEDWLADKLCVGSEEAQQALLHTLLHCMMGHLWDRTGEDYTRWDLACDLACEYAARALLDKPPRDGVLLKLKLMLPRGGVFSAKQIYNKLECVQPEKLMELRNCLPEDDHSPWGRVRERRQLPLFSGEGDGNSALWKREREKLCARLQDTLPKIGTGAGNIKTAFPAITQTDHRFAEFLRIFSSVQENRHVNDTDFQYSWFLYGMEHYDRMPLLEPLEYSEECRLRELAIVLDTSASCSRGLAEHFLGAIYAILCQERLFFERFNLHIIQCDAQIQRDTKLTDLDEFQWYMDHLELIGGGGTDFRPAFQYIDRLIAQGELPHLKGILYFTDGYGVFPEKAPDYLAAFVMLRHRCDEIDIPPWALKLVLEAELPKGDEQWI